MAIEEILIRFQGAVGFADSNWLKLSPGIAVLTGKNNVGKSRLLRTIGDLPAAAGGPAPYSNVPQVRVVTSEGALETDIRSSVRDGYSLSPTSYTVFRKDGNPDFEIAWKVSPQAEGISIQYGPAGGVKAVAQLGHVATTGAGLPPIRNMLYLDKLPDLLSALDSLVYIPPERPFRASQPTNVVMTPKPDGSDLPQVIYYHRGHGTPQYDQLQQIIRGMFPEIEFILTPPTANGEIALSVRDRFVPGASISLDNAGTGLARVLHLIACVLMYPPHRTFLVDEPTTHLHPGSEKALAGFFRDHTEHSYVISTHSPIMINALQPDRAWLTVRDDRGIVVEPALSDPVGRRHIFQELGVAPGDVAVAERLLFVEGKTDYEVYPVILEKLGWNPAAYNREIIKLDGADAAESLQHVIEMIEAVMNFRYLIYLDGDKTDAIRGRRVKYLPVDDVERLFLRDPAAILQAFKQIVGQEHPDIINANQAAWTEEVIADFIKQRKGREKGKQVLDALAHAMGFTYMPTVYGPVIARAMDPRHFEDLRGGLADLFS